MATGDNVVKWIEEEWDKIDPDIKNDKQQTIYDAINKTPGNKNKGFTRAVEIRAGDLTKKAEPYIDKTNKEYQDILEPQIEGAKTIQELNQLYIDQEYKVSSKLQKSLDAQRRFLEIEQKTEERKKLERREDLIRRYIDRGFTKEQAEDIVGD